MPQSGATLSLISIEIDLPYVDICEFECILPLSFSTKLRLLASV